MPKRLRFIADAGELARSVGVSALAIALAVYAMVLQDQRASAAVLAAIILLIAAGAVLQVSRAVQQLRRKHDELSQAAVQAEHHYFEVLRRLLAAIEARDWHTRGRSERIGHLARRIGEALGLDDRQSGLLGLAGQVHDVGQLAVPESILNKPSRLGNEELRMVRKHAEQSYRILEPLRFLAEVLPAIRYHHERMNGTGYPFGLKGEEIPLTARILAVADSYDAMTHDRPHRPALPAIEAMNELERCSPAGYDPRCVEALEGVMSARPLREAHEAAESRESEWAGLKQDAPETSPQRAL